jgi:hypothetical protein
MMSKYRQQQGLTYWTCQLVKSLLHDFIVLSMSGSSHHLDMHSQEVACHCAWLEDGFANLGGGVQS